MTRRDDVMSGPSASERLRRFVQIDRTEGAEGSHPAARATHERPQTRSDAARVREYTRIERGRTA